MENALLRTSACMYSYRYSSYRYNRLELLWKIFRSSLFVSLVAVVSIKPVTMKFSTALVLASFVNSASAFSAVAPGSIDRSLRGIDSEESAFDPTAGESPALILNNNDQVWVPQVRT
jgi:hypothetical protein